MTDTPSNFNVWKHRKRLNKTIFSYADYFMVSLMMERGRLYFADKWIEIEPGTLVFANPAQPSAWEPAEDELAEKGYSCSFNHKFLRKEEWGFLLNTPLLDLTKEQTLFLKPETTEIVKQLFLKMMALNEEPDEIRIELLHSCLHLIIYEAMQGTQERPRFKPQHNAAQRTVELFLVLLDRQFPTNYPDKILEMRSATDYAQGLSIHVNHLNRVVKQITGKTTTDIIAGRIIQEAVRLLKNSSLNIAEITYTLGFEEQASFTAFFKRKTGKGPKAYRNV